MNLRLIRRFFIVSAGDDAGAGGWDEILKFMSCAVLWPFRINHGT